MKNIAVTINEYLNENNKLNFSEEQKKIAKNLFKKVFDIYLRKVTPKTYPMIYHCTTIDKYSSIKNNGITGERTYFLDNDNDLHMYGFNDEGERVPGIACGVNYINVIERLYPDPEWLMGILKKIGNPSDFKRKGIDDDVIHCLWVVDFLELDLNSELTLDDVSEVKIDFMISDRTFHWLYVKGDVRPELITIQIHPDLK